MSDTTRRTRPIASVLDVLRARVDPDAFDVVVFGLEAVVADLGFGDVRPLPGSLAWVDALRADGKRTGVVFAGSDARTALELAGVAERFDAVACRTDDSRPLERVLEELGTRPERAVVVDTGPEGLAAADRAALRIGLARGASSPEALRRAGADAVVADLQELLGAR